MFNKNAKYRINSSKIFWFLATGGVYAMHRQVVSESNKIILSQEIVDYCQFKGLYGVGSAYLSEKWANGKMPKRKGNTHTSLGDW